MEVLVKVEGMEQSVQIAGTGKDIEGVEAADIHIEGGKAPEIKLRLCSGYVSVLGNAAYTMVDPASGTVKEVTQITFRDGSVWPREHK